MKSTRVDTNSRKYIELKIPYDKITSGALYRSKSHQEQVHRSEKLRIDIQQCLAQAWSQFVQKQNSVYMLLLLFTREFNFFLKHFLICEFFSVCELCRIMLEKIEVSPDGGTSASKRKKTAI